MKEPKCKICGGRHYQYQCWQKPRKPIKSRKNIPTKIGSKPTEKKKTYNLSCKNKTNRKTLVNRLDGITSQYVRLLYSNKAGKCRCYTCGVVKDWKDLDCGHFIKRGNIQTRWVLDNLRPQCVSCNRYKSGNYEVYEKRLRDELGENKFQELLDKSNRNQKFSTPELEELLAVRQELLENLKKVR